MKQYCGILTPEEFASLYGPDWRQLPRIYAAGAIMAGHIKDIVAHHRELAKALAPEFLLLSPLRGRIIDGQPSDDWFSDRDEIICRDLQDVRSCKAVLVNLKPQMIEVPVAEGRTISVEQAMTGTVVEVFEATYHCHIPVVGYNADYAARQIRSPWFNQWVTRIFQSSEQAVAYLKTGFSL